MDNETHHVSLPGADEGELFRTLFGAYPDGLVVTAPDGAIVMANPAAAQLLGYPPEQLAGMPVDALVPDDIRPRHAAYRAAYASQPKSRPMGASMDLVAQRRDGTRVVVEIGLSPLQDHGVPLVAAAIRDVTAYPRVKAAMRRARYGDFLALAGRVAVDARDADALLQQVPELAAQALEVEAAAVFLLERDRLDFRVAGGVGLGPDEAVGGLFVNTPNSAAGLMLLEGRTIAVDDFRTETRFAAPVSHLAAGLRSAAAAPLKDRGRIIGALVARSREAGRFGEDELRFLESMSSLLGTSLQRARGEEALNHAARLESVGQLTGGIAHDFNNLLTVILGNLQVIEDLPCVAGDDYARQLADAAARAARRGADLTSKLLAFSRRQVLRSDTVDLRKVIDSLIDMLRRTVDQRIVIEEDVAAECPHVLADPGQLETSLLNIAINARDAMPQGGTLRIGAAPCPALPVRARNDLDDPSAPANGFVAIAVSDTGTGMTDAVKERAFEPFFTTKAAGRGTGLGLSTVYGFAKQSRGAVSIDSTPGAGTTITLYLPRVHAPPAPDGQRPEATPELPPGLEVLVVEDDRVVSEVARAFLRSLGCNATVAFTAEHALLLLEKQHRFDVLMTDISLGSGMRGTALAQVARERFPGLAVLLVSGYSAEHLEGRESLAGFELLNKPYRREELGLAIARAISGSGTQPRGG